MEIAHDDLRRFYAHAATLEPTDAEVARVLSAIDGAARAALCSAGVEQF